MSTKTHNEHTKKLLNNIKIGCTLLDPKGERFNVTLESYMDPSFWKGVIHGYYQPIPLNDDEVDLLRFKPNSYNILSFEKLSLYSYGNPKNRYCLVYFDERDLQEKTKHTAHHFQNIYVISIMCMSYKKP